MLLFTGCYDLGDFKDVEDYYSTFEVATFVAQDLSKTEYLVSEYLYNEETVDNDTCFIVEDEYIYVAIHSSRNLTCRAISLGVCSDIAKILNVTLFIGDSVEEFVGYEYIIKSYIDTHPSEYGNIDESMFVPVGRKVASTTVNLSPSIWNYVYIDPISVNVVKDQYIVLRFDNNSGFNCGKDQNVSLKITNLLLQAKF